MTTDYKHIEELLNRYWECETSLEEEAELRAFFLSEEVPVHLYSDRDLFLYQSIQQEVSMCEGFEERMLRKIEVAVQAKQVGLWKRIMPMFRAAAIVFAVLWLSNIIRQSFFIDEIEATDVCADICNDSAIVYEEASNVLQMLSEEINKSAVVDSLGIAEIEQQ